MTYELGRTLLLSEAVSPEALAAALHVAVAERVSLVRALLTVKAIEPARLEEELASADAPVQPSFVPVASLMDLLPAGMCERLLAIPVRHDEATGAVDVVVADARDLHAAEEIAFILQVPVRVLRAPLTAIEAALGRDAARRAPANVRALAVPMATPPPPRADGTPPPRAVTPAWGDSEADDIPIPLSRRISTIDALARDSVAAEVETRVDARVEARADAMMTDARAERTTTPALDDDGPVMELRHRKTPPEFAAPALAPSSAASSKPTSSEPASKAVASSLPAPPPSLDAILLEMACAEGRDALLDLVLRGVRTMSLKAAIFVVKKEGYVAWMCTAELADNRQLQAITIDSSAHTFLSAAAAAGRYVGRILESEAHAPLLRLMRSPAPEVAAVVVRVSGRPAAVITVSELADPVLALPRLDELARAAGVALERIVRRSRPSSAPAHGP